ncbi:MAG: transposase [Candidatus Sumerlaeota bacterium]|nr:transposase [Candidatus Sumerlaeota bacterium]
MGSYWHSRGYIPHFEGEEIIQSVTFRLADSVPADVVQRFAWEIGTRECEAAYRRRIEEFLDVGHGECWLRRAPIARLVHDSLLCYNGARYRLYAWVIMPNHIHVLLEPISPQALATIVQGWKSYTARQINALLGRRGTVWQREYWDRFMRNEEHFLNTVEYIHSNPVKTGLAERAEDWPWSSCAR